MDFINKNYKWIIIVLLCLNLITCAKGCGTSRKLSDSQELSSSKERQINQLKSKNQKLQHRLDLLNERQYGLEKQMAVQSDAMNQINKARKNVIIVRR